MKYKSIYTVTALLLIIAFGVMLALLSFRFASSNIEKVSIEIATQPATNKFDNLLVNNLTSLARGTFLKTLLANKEHDAYIAPFAISRCQITQQQYNSFAQWLQFTEKRDKFIDSNFPNETGLQSRFIEHKLLGRPDAPVTGVDYYQASSYCRSAGGRLPSKDEWEAVATGKEGRLYPWGDIFAARPWRFRNPILNVINHCDAYPESATPEGVLDMGNSVSEWTEGDKHQAVLKGGNAFNRPYKLHSLNVIDKQTPKNFSSQFVGFRCAFDQINSEQISLPWDEVHQVIPVEAGKYTLGIPSTARLPSILSNIDQDSISQLAVALNSKQTSSSEAVQVSQYEITVGEYAWFLRDPLVRFNFYANESQPSDHSYLPDEWQQQLQNQDAPVTGVSWWDAYAYASWAGGNLPSVAQWNSWYGGSNGYIYPWGDQYKKGLALVRDQDFITAQSVTRSKDINDYGLVGLAGNVSEWTSSLYLGSNEQSMIIKGGNFLIKGEEAARVDYIARAPLYHRSKTIGFRVVFQ